MQKLKRVRRTLAQSHLQHFHCTTEDQVRPFYRLAVPCSSFTFRWFRTDRLESYYWILTFEPALLGLCIAVISLSELQQRDTFTACLQEYLVAVQWKSCVRSNTDCLLSHESNRLAQRENGSKEGTDGNTGEK